MTPRYLPKTPQRKVVHLMEECAEVIHVCAKLLRFGMDTRHPKTGERAKTRLRAELRDLEAAVAKVEALL